MKLSKFFKYLFLVSIFPVLVLSSCKDLSNEKEENKTLAIDLTNIKQQLNESRSTNAITGSGGAKGLVIGAIVITSRDTPYTSGESLTQDEEDALVDDLINSVNFITIANLPISEDYIEFLIPPETADKWQVVVFAVDFKLNNLADISDYESKGEITHTGFSEKFYSSSSVGNSIIPINMETYTKE